MQNDSSKDPTTFFLSPENLQQYNEIHDSAETLPAFTPPHNQEIIANRLALRKFLSTQGYEQPDFFSGTNFSDISAWAVRRNLFPLLLKSSKNEFNCKNSYVLRAFRELPDFYSAIDSKLPLLIESFFTATTFIESTYQHGQRIFISQTGMHRSLKFRHHWRVFPVFPPAACLKQIKKAESHFSSIIKEAGHLPVRITFAFTKSATTPLSINLGFNRLEYFAPWSGMLDENKESLNKKEFFKLLLYNFPRDNSKKINKAELQDMLKQTLQTMAIAPESAILLKSCNPGLLLEDAKKADSILIPFETAQNLDYKKPEE